MISINKIEKIFHNDRLDIEFCIKNNNLYIFQCRPLKTIAKADDYKIKEAFIVSLDNSTIHLAKKHDIEITDENFSSLFKSSSFHVNTYHKNLIQTEGMGNGLKSFAIFNKDGSVEGFFHEKLPIIGVMWHPERDPDINSKAIISTIFKNKKFLGN